MENLNSKNQILIIGGGVIGLSCAAELARRGASITLIDKGTIGHGCSYGNAGWMTPCFAMPLPMPGMFFKSLKWLFDPESPLYIKPEFSFLLTRWLLKFLSSMNEKQAFQAIEALVQLSTISLDEYKRLDIAHQGAFQFKKKGLLMVGQTEEGVQLALEEMQLVARHKIPGKFLSAEEIKIFEPALIGPLKGGVYFPSEAHAEPLQTIYTLAAEAKKYGAKIIENVEFISPEIVDKKIKSINTTHGFFKADQFILATGSWSTEIAKNLRLRVPILGGKGYALITPKLQPNPTYPMMLIEKKIAITPRENSLRIAGTLELVNQDFSITEKRVQTIVRGAREFLNIPQELKIEELWRGLRPCTPDGVPMIGYTKNIDNLVLAAGHQMLGLQSGAGTGKLVADIIENKADWINTKIFDPNRF